jgi:hypothetical protein
MDCRLVIFCKNVFCFEPSERLDDQLLLSIDKNKFGNIKAFNIGIGNENKKVPIHSDTANRGGTSIFV